MKQSSVILLVENDKDYIYILEQSFRKADIRSPLKIARYGNEATLYLRGIGIYSERAVYPLPALILLDMTNPDGSSMALLRWIRDQRQFDPVPVVVLIGAKQDEELQSAFDSGANAFAVKRENVRDLITMIQSLDLFGENSAEQHRNTSAPLAQSRA